MAAITTRGTVMWFYDKENSQIVKIGCPTDLGEISKTRDTNESPACLETGNKVKFTGGVTIADQQISVNYDPKEVSHKRLNELFDSGAENIPIVIGYSDGDDAPEWSGSYGTWILADTRSWDVYLGSLTEDTHGWAADSAVSGTFSFAVNEHHVQEKSA